LGGLLLAVALDFYGEGLGRKRRSTWRHFANPTRRPSADWGHPRHDVVGLRAGGACLAIRIPPAAFVTPWTVHGRKFRSSNSATSISASKNLLGSGWMIIAPSEAKKAAIRSCTPKAICLAIGTGLSISCRNRWGSFGTRLSSAKARSLR